MLSVQSSLWSCTRLRRSAQSSKKQTYLPRLATGELIGCFGLTEADAGSDPGLYADACPENRVWIQPVWFKDVDIKCAPADLFVIWAKSEAHDGKIKGFLVEKGAKGLSADVIKGKLSLRASMTGSITLDEVAIGEDALLPHVEGLKGPFSCLNKARYGISWGALGAAEFFAGTLPALIHLSANNLVDRWLVIS